MKNALNNPIYYLPYVKIREDFKTNYSRTLKQGEELPIHDDICGVMFDPKEIEIMVAGTMGCDIVKIPMTKVDLFVKAITPKFKLGQVVKVKGGKAYRVFQYTIVQGKVWYRDGWSVATDCESGHHEENLTEATEKEKNSWEVEYNDGLMLEKHPQMFNAIMN